MSYFKYLAKSAGSPLILKVEIESETLKSVFFRDGQKAAKHSISESYFDTWNEAKEHMRPIFERRISEARIRLELANSLLGNLKGLREQA